MVDLSKKPFYLDEEAIRWVRETESGMTIEEKIGQLFIVLLRDESRNDMADYLEKYHVGGIRYMNKPAAQVQEQNRFLQNHSRIPLLIATNSVEGGLGGASDGTFIANQPQVGAIGSEDMARKVGVVAGQENEAMGCNWTFGPVVDIYYNWRNTLINNRAYGNDPEEIIRLSRAFLEGVSQSNVAGCCKHFPGDGIEERDQHLVMGINDLEPEQWDATYGRVYEAMIESGVMSIMAGHFAMPKYSKFLRPGIRDEEIRPATLAPEIILDLLRGKLQFNGVVVTDATHMLGMTSVMPRSKQVPGAIAAGCDMFLFMNDMDEDFGFMMEGYRSGVITEERLRDSLYRILGMKAALGMHKKTGSRVPGPEALQLFGNDKFRRWEKEAADASITLVKDTAHNLPLDPKKFPRLKLVYMFGDIGNRAFMGTDEDWKVIDDKRRLVISELERVGFQVSLHIPSAKSDSNCVQRLKENYDAVLLVLNVRGYARENTVRIKWTTGHSDEVPWYAPELPTVCLSLNYTTHLHDVPMVKTYINAYADTQNCIRSAIEKMIGESEFHGKYNDTVFCGKWETHL